MLHRQGPWVDRTAISLWATPVPAAKPAPSFWGWHQDAAGGWLWCELLCMPWALAVLLTCFPCWNLVFEDTIKIVLFIAEIWKGIADRHRSGSANMQCAGLLSSPFSEHHLQHLSSITAADAFEQTMTMKGQSICTSQGCLTWLRVTVHQLRDLVGKCSHTGPVLADFRFNLSRGSVTQHSSVMQNHILFYLTPSPPCWPLGQVLHSCTSCQSAGSCSCLAMALSALLLPSTTIC